MGVEWVSNWRRLYPCAKSSKQARNKLATSSKPARNKLETRNQQGDIDTTQTAEGRRDYGFTETKKVQHLLETSSLQWPDFLSSAWANSTASTLNEPHRHADLMQASIVLMLLLLLLLLLVLLLQNPVQVAPVMSDTHLTYFL